MFFSAKVTMQCRSCQLCDRSILLKNGIVREVKYLFNTGHLSSIKRSASLSKSFFQEYGATFHTARTISLSLSLLDVIFPI